jgi:outer membrane lipoprotein-sorting protein
MLTKTKLVLAAALLAATASAALAQDADPNLLNRYPSYNGVAAPQATFQSAPVGLRQDRNLGEVQTSRPQPQTFHYDSAPLVSGAGY